MKKSLTLPSDHELIGMVYALWRSSLNQEVSNIAGCMASNLRVENTPEFSRAIKKQLDRLVREKRIRRTRFLPGRPTYTIA
jgi:hypothetical protein